MADQTREDLGQEILNLCAGRPTEEVLAVFASTLGCTIGGLCHMGGYSQEGAIAILDAVRDDAASHIRENWGQIKVAQ